MNLIPSPKKIEIRDGFLKSKILKMDNMPTDERIVKALRHFSFKEDGVSMEILMGGGDGEEYSVEIEQDNIIIRAETAQGVFYALQTLRQLFTEERIPCCYIKDKPDFKHRGFYHDATRGRVPKIESVKKLIDDMAYYKLNSLQLYVEHTFEFKEFKDSIERTGYLSAEELKEIDSYCKENFIDFIPSIATFGHLYELLQKDRYKHLQEIEDFESGEFFWENRMQHHTIDPTKEESFEIIKSLIDQYMVNFTSDRFNICCDETFDLKRGKHKEEDTGKLYIDFVTKIIKYLQSKGKKVMMWADILLNHPEQIDNLPEDVELLNWYYWGDPDEKTFRLIQESGRTQIVCPGTGSWMGFCENYEMDLINIPKMAEYGYQYGAEGVLNTNWGDWGNPCSIELAMFGLTLGAEKSWNVSTKIDDAYIASVNKLVYKKDNATEYIRRLSNCCAMIDWNLFARCYANILTDGQAYNIEYTPLENVLYAIKECKSIIESVNGEEWQEEKFKKHIALSAKAVMIMAENIALLAGYDVKKESDVSEWLKQYRMAWLEDNKESELSEIEKVFVAIDNKTSGIYTV